MTELTVAFHISANELKNVHVYVEITRITCKEETTNTHKILDGKPDLTWKI